MRFDRSKFFSGYRSEFGSLKQYQVDNLTQLLDGYERYWGWWDDLRQIANSLAQVRMESAFSFGPVAEGYYLGDPNAKNYFIGNTPKVWTFQSNLRYAPYFGRGHIQLTHLDNYSKLTILVRRYFPELAQDVERRTGQRFDMASYPEQAFDPWISFAVMTVGMHQGTFRDGHTLDRYITPSLTDYDGARNIVNGDRNYKRDGVRIGEIIRRDSAAFAKILKAALIVDKPKADDDLLELAVTPEPTQIPFPTPTEATVSLPTGPSQNVEPAVNEQAVVAANPEPSNVADTAALPPDDPPATLTVEDWKPWVMRWLKRIWGFFAGANFTQISSLSVAGLSDSQNWMYYAAAIVVLIVLIGGCATAVSIPLLIWLFLNRRELKASKELEAKTNADPTQGTLVVRVEKK